MTPFKAKLSEGRITLTTPQGQVEVLATPVEGGGLLIEHPDFVDIFPSTWAAIAALAVHSSKSEDAVQ